MIGNHVIAFLICIAAGMSTTLGAAVVYSPYLVKLSNRNILAGGLGLSAGVMLYVSFVEIFMKSHSAFLQAGYSEKTAYLYATLCFFGGLFFMRAIDSLSHYMEHQVSHPHDVKSEVSGDRYSRQNHANEAEVDDIEVMLSMVHQIEEDFLLQEQGNGDHRKSNSNNNHHGGDNRTETTFVTEPRDLELMLPATDTNIQTNSNNNILQADEDETIGNNDNSTTVLPPTEENLQLLQNQSSKQQANNHDYTHIDTHNHTSIHHNAGHTHHDQRQLKQMGFMTALAIGIHNFPEGLATFVATAENPQVGIALAIAVAIHNIPEGLCVAVPLYYSSGNRHYAFWYAFLSGISEVFGGVLGWVILSDLFNELIYAIIFGLVAGMMVCITLYELLPTAIKCQDKKHPHLVADCMMVGMGIMALSLVAFKFN